jgi:hypothetical protein
MKIKFIVRASLQPVVEAKSYAPSPERRAMLSLCPQFWIVRAPRIERLTVTAASV